MAVQKMLRTIFISTGIIVLTLTAGCKSKEQKALDQAKAQATSSNTPQQVQYVDEKGDTITKTVEPPATAGGQPAVSTLITPPPPGLTPHSTDPVVTPLDANTQNVAAQGAPPPSANGQPESAANQPPTQPNQPPPVSISVPAGTELAIRLDHRISVRTTRAGDHFSGEVVEPVMTNGNIVIPHGTPVSGRVVESHHGGHFRGRSVLELRLTGITLGGYEYPLETHDSGRSSRGKGRRSAGIIGGMTGAGMLIGGIASGGVGLAIGAAAGAGSGTAIAAGTGNHNLDIPAESVIHFRLADSLVIQNP